MINTKMAVITGPPGVGKTALSHKVCETIHERYACVAVHVEVDNLRWMIVGNVREQWPFPVWLSLTEGVVRESRAFAEFILVDGLFYECGTIQQFVLTHPGTKVFRVEAALDVCLRRNRYRESTAERLRDEDVKRLYLPVDSYAWHVLDGNQSIENVVKDLIIALG